MHRAIRYGLIGVAAATLLLGAAGGWLLGSTSGAASVLGLIPGLQVAQVRGRLYDGLQLQGVRWRDGDTRLTLAHLNLHWSPRALWRASVQIDTLEGDGLRLLLPAANGQTTTTARPRLRLPLDLQLERLALSDMQIRQGDARLFSGDLQARAQLHHGRLQLQTLAVQADRLRLQANGTLPLDGQDGLALSLTWSASTPELGKLRGSARLSGRLDALQVDHQLTAPWAVRSSGSLRPFDDMHLELKGSWSALAWPLGPHPKFTSPTGKFQLQGTPSSYDITLQGQMLAPDLPPQTISLAGHGNGQSLQLHSLSSNGPGGRLDGRGRIAWSPHPSWSLALTTQGFDPASIAPDWPGAIDLKGRLEGELSDQGLSQTLQLQALGGQLRGYPVSGQGRLRQRDGRIEFQALALHSASNTLTLDGRLGERLDLRFNLVLDQPDALLPRLAGRLQGSGRLQGTRDAPQLQMSAQGDNLAWQDYRLGQLALQAHWGLGDGAGRVQLTGAGLEIGDERFDRVEAGVEGDTGHHRIRLLLDGAALNLRAAADGGWSADHWQGQLKALTLTQASVGEWALTKAADLRLDADTARLGPACLSHATSRICGDMAITAGRNIAAKATLEALAVAEWAHLLGDQVRGSGQVSATLQVSGTLDTPSIEARVIPTRGSLQWPVVGGTPVHVDYQLEEMTYTRQGGDGALAFRFDLGPRGRLAGRFKHHQERLDGRFTLASEDPAWLGEWLTQVSEIRGRLDLEGQLGGTLQAPTLALQGGLSDGHLIVADSGIEVEQIALHFSPAAGGRFALQGSARSGGGNLTVDGWVDTATPAWSLQLKGEAFQVARLPQTQIWVSPDLAFTQQDGKRQLRGEVRVPRAEIDLQGLPEGSVSESADVVVLGPQGRPASAAPAAGPGYLESLNLDLALRLGDAVRLKGYGLKTRLKGRLQLTLQAGQLLAQGRISLVEGSYKAYGQELTLEQGDLVFSGPLDDPSLDLLASRTANDGSVKALLRVTGSLQQPKLAITSEPALPAGEALSYLITGTSLADADKEQGAAIYSAALSLGLTQSEPLLTEMRDRLGLDELQIKGGHGLEDTALSLGKQLQENLYLGYTVGLFDNTGAILLRLKLGKHLELETRSGERQSVDLFYRSEHD